MISILSVMLMVRLLAWNFECLNLMKLLDRINSRRNEIEENVIHPDQVTTYILSENPILMTLEDGNHFIL